ncbi:MAG: amidohydrolase family protein [Planctomycetaceae bacterium]
MTSTLYARHFETMQSVCLQFDGEHIASAEPYECSPSEADGLPIVGPGLFDIQVNGYGGSWFSSQQLTVESVIEIIQSLVRQGIARCFPTLITASFEALQHGFQTLQAACRESELVNDCVAGFHLEGPYISAVDGPRGAHPLQHVRPTNRDEFQRLQKAAGGRIRLVTLAAESPGAVEFIQLCRQSGVTVALGHMAATTGQIQEAVAAGAQLSTHFGNGAHGVMPRHPNYLWDQLADDHLWASVIADGWHVPASVLKCVLKCKTADRIILTCDVSGFGGCVPGTYQEGDVGVEVLEDGRIVVAGQRQFLAGSGATTGECVAEMMRACGVSLSMAIRMATSNPGRLLNEPISDLRAGSLATLTVFRMGSDPEGGRSRFRPQKVYIRGREYGGS